MTVFPRIDYDSHPAYSRWGGEYSYDDNVIGSHIVAVDGLHERITSQTRIAATDIHSCLADMRVELRRIDQHLGEAGAPIVAREWLNAVFEWVMAGLAYDYTRIACGMPGALGEKVGASGREQLNMLRDSGLYVTDLADDDYGEIVERANAYRPQLVSRLASDPLARCVHSPSRLSPLGRAIQRSFDRAGVFSVVNAYSANKMRIMGTGLEYSREGQEWYPRIYSDVGLTDGPLQYLHVDEADYTMKAIIYATKVGDENGPTSFIPGSNRWARSELCFRSFKGLDRLTHDRYSRFGPSGYRPVARNPKLREVFMQLPRAFRGSSHFGDDVLGGTALATELTQGELRFMPQKAQAVVFDGSRTLHRGALVRAGERIAMQVVLVNSNDQRIRRGLRKDQKVRGLMSRMRGLVKAAIKG